MIVFKKLSWKNFLSTGNQPNTVLLNKSTTTLIIGKNGEGKSTILDALCFALFGKPFRNINKQQMINSINGKNALVEIEFSIGKKEYKIIRGIKPNVFEIWLDGEMVNQDAASRDYQKILEQQILRINYKTFTQVVILGSASFVPFMQLTNAQRREVIEDILDIKIFSTMNQLLKEKQNAVKDEIVRVENELTVSRAKVESQQAIIKTISQAKSESIKAIQNKIDSNRSEISREETSISTLVAEIESLNDKIKSKVKVEEDVDKAKHLKSKLASKIEHCEHTEQFFTDNHTCPSCEQQIGEDHKSKVIAGLQEKMRQDQQRTQELEEVLSKLNGKLQEYTQCSLEIAEKSIALSTHTSAVSILNKQITEMQTEIENTQEDNHNLVEEKNKDQREVIIKKFKQDLKNRIDETSKYIRPAENTMDFAFMFIPSEAIYNDLLTNKIGTADTASRDLIEYAFQEKKVIIVSPTTFMAYLQTVLQGLRSLQIEEQAKEIQKRVGMLGRHIKNYEQFMHKLGNSLGTTVNHYNNAHKELKKVDKDVVKIAGSSEVVEPLTVDGPSTDE